MNSHIIVPKCVLKKFALDCNGFHKYEVQNDRISRGYPKTTFTEKDYYSDTMEELLCISIETPLNRLYEYIEGFKETDILKPIIMDAEIVEIVATYVKSLIARNPRLCDMVNEDNIWTSYMSQQARHDITVFYAMQEKTMDNMFDKFDVSFMINETETPFVLPTRGLFEFCINSIQCMNAPLTPWCAIMLKEKDKAIFNKHLGLNEITIFPKGYDDRVMLINHFAMQRQKDDKIGCVICNKREILEKLMLEEYIND